MITKRIRPRCQGYMARLFLERPSMAPGAGHLETVAERLGVTGLQVVKARKDTTIVARGVHPEWGAVALKVCDPVLRPRIASAALRAHEYFVGNPAPIFPRVHACDLGYAVTEWIEGGMAALLDPRTMESLPAVALVDSLLSWSGERSGEELLSDWELRSSIRFFVEASIRRMQYVGGAKCLMASARFAADRGRLGGLFDRMADLIPRLRLRRGVMLADLDVWNLVYEERAGRLVYIDLEALRPGHALFDAVFLLARTLIERMPRELTERLARHVFSEACMPDAPTAEFFRCFASYVVTSTMTIDGHDGDTIQDGLALIDAGA